MVFLQLGYFIRSLSKLATGASRAPRQHPPVRDLPYLGCNAGVPSVSGDGQFQGAAVFEALVERGFEVEPDGVGVVLLGLGFVAAHHLLAKGKITAQKRY